MFMKHYAPNRCEPSIDVIMKIGVRGGCEPRTELIVKNEGGGPVGGVGSGWW